MRKEIKSIFISVTLSLFLILVAYFVFAAIASNGVKVISPISGGNYSANFTINCSYINITDITNPIASDSFFYINTTSSWVMINNATPYTITNNSIFFTADIISITDGNNSALNCTLGNNTEDEYAYISLANMSTRIAIDDTPPAVVAINALAGINYSGISNSTSYSTAGAFLNITLNVTDAVLGPNIVLINISNWSGKTEALLNATIAAGNAGIYYNTTGFNISKYTEGNYTIQIIANDTMNNTNKSLTSGIIWFDSSRPIVFRTNFSNPTPQINGTNYTQILKVNITVIDTNPGANSSGVASVLFRIINATGNTENATVAATREGTTDRWSYLLNTTSYPDGTYNITAFVNDSAKNSNNSAWIGWYRFDNANPSLSYSCSPSSVEEGETVTCTCSGSDTGAGIASSNISYTSSPSTSLTGTFTLSCTGTDNVGHSVSASASYTVTGIGGGTGGGGGGGGGTTTPPGKTQSWTKVTPGAATIMKNFDKAYGIKEITIEVNNEAQNVKITVTKYDSKPAEVTKAKEGKVYKYLQIKAENLAEKLQKGKLTIQVEKSWATSNNLAKEKLALFKFENSDWKELKTDYKSEDVTNYYYDVEVSSFSYFAIGEKVEAKPAEEEKPATPAEVVKETAKKAFNFLKSTWFWIIIAAVILLIILYFIYRKTP